MSELLKKAAQKAITEDEFYDYFRKWYAQTESALKDLVFEEIEHYWAHTHFPRAPKNIMENDRDRLRILATALDEKWDPERTEYEVDQY